MKTKTKITNTTPKKVAVMSASTKQSFNVFGFLISLLKSLQNLFNKFTPFIWFLKITFWIRSTILSFFTSFKVIKITFAYLNQLPVFQLLRNIIRILSIISLLLNVIILGIFTQFSPLLWISYFPAVSQIGAFVFDSMPEKSQGWFMWIVMKIKTFLFWIWNSLLDFIRTIIKAVIGEIEKTPITPDPIIEPDKGKYEDIQNPQVVKFLDDWKWYIIGGSVLIITLSLGYIYWDSISFPWKKRPDNDSNYDSQFVPLPVQPDVHGPIFSSLPSPDSSNSSNSINQFFRRSILDKVLGYRDKVKSYFTANKSSSVIPADYPAGIYTTGSREMYKGLPLPRVETYDGTEYFFNKDPDGYINILSGSYADSDIITINPFSGKAISKLPSTVMQRVAMINRARESQAFFNSPVNSWVRNQTFDGIEVGMDLNRPDFGSTSASSQSNLPGFLVDKGKNRELTEIPLNDPDYKANPNQLFNYKIYI
jgi:hypothetical protein